MQAIALFERTSAEPLPVQRARATPPAGPFPLKRVLAFSDLSSAATNAAWRAALVARDHGGWLRILHVAPGGGGREAAQARLDELAGELQQRLNIAVLAQAVRGNVQRELAAAAREADLLVLRGACGQPVRDWLRGWHPERLIQRCAIPALVVRRPALASYRRVLVSVDLDGQAPAIIAAATAMSRGPHLEVLHALGTLEEETLRIADVPVQVLRDRRERIARQVRATLQELAEQAGPGHTRIVPCVLFGHPPATVLAKERALLAELMVMGRRSQGWLAGLLPGSVSRPVLARTLADVLLLPRRAHERAA